ncbi:RES family NAD+ phosphorylase [Marinobacter caseinilyticus]|uniref:RES family NAD+ phosphorylase n=1 Tax=Marinobacter caseinilyticus TaxID=2692195 RepID=UPI00140CEF8A|nr:RES family NAD+ phosphorylase [Marinobacter caseinilyticus]
MRLTDRIEAAVSTFQGELFRVVESQEEVATTQLVDNLAEQAVLEDMIELSKPPRPESTAKLHYLLATPFRYPPLRYGSRFGRPYEKSLFYGGTSIEAALVESAFYRFVFLRDVVVPFAAPLKSEHLLFSARYLAQRGIKLQASEWRAEQDELTDPGHYDYCQNLGSTMRNMGIDAFQYPSARARQLNRYFPGQGQNDVNGALFNPTPLMDRQPQSQLHLLMTTEPDTVMMRLQQQDGTRQSYTFHATPFLVNGRLARPAA